MSRSCTLDREGQRHIFVFKKKGEVVVRAMSDNSPLSDQVVASTDNAVAESFRFGRFNTLKAECVYQNKFVNKQQAAEEVF